MPIRARKSSRTPNRYRIWWLTRHGEYRKGTSYRRNPEHTPKERDLNCEIWRRQVERDKAKHRGYGYQGYGKHKSRKGWAKNVCNRWNRRKGRTLLKQGRFEDLSALTESGDFSHYLWN